MTGILADQTGFDGVGKWLSTSANWWGPDGIAMQARDHLIYSAIVLVVAALIALPIGMAVGHTGRGVVAVVGIANALRAIPTLGLVVFLYVWLSNKIPVNHHPVLFLQRGGVPTFLLVAGALVLLAIPPIVTNTYAGIQAVEPEVRDAARGMGMRGMQALFRVEVPCALPLIISGFRSATLQVIATVTVAAYLPALGGLGRFIADGAQSLGGYGQEVGAGLIVAGLAITIDLLLGLLQRIVVSPGVSGRFSRRPGVTSEPMVEAQLTHA